MSRGGRLPHDCDALAGFTLSHRLPRSRRWGRAAAGDQWRAALDRLTLPERESVILRAQNLTLREIADILQTRPRRVAALLVRAIARLKQALDA
jgi:DNA-directed RNA polymerase specialized sigma24 family protein